MEFDKDPLGFLFKAAVAGRMFEAPVTVALAVVGYYYEGKDPSNDFLTPY